MDPQIEELKELVRRAIALSEDTNRIVHSMRNQGRWNAVFKAIWWLVILGVTFAAYSYFMPYLQQIMQLYSSLGSSGIFQSLGR